MEQQNLQPDNEDRLVALGRVLQILREEENADVLIETTLDYLCGEFKYRLIWIGLYDRLDHRLIGKGGIAPTDDATFLKQRFNLNPGDLLEQVVIQQRPVGVSDLRQETRAGEWRRAAQEFGIQGTLIFPLHCKDRCFGVALLGSPLWGVSPRPAEKAQLSLLLGGLAAALYQIEVEWQRSSIKRPDQPLFQVLNELMNVPTLALRFEAVVTMTQEFIAPTRTNLYWYSPERRYFWHRLGNRQSIPSFGESRTSAAGLTVAEVNDFYQALAGGQLVAIGAGRSLLTSKSTERLLARLRTRSLLAAPIQAQGELLGFLAVEDNEARIWEEAERNYIRATAQLLGLVAGNEELEATLQETQKDTHFAAEIAQAIAKHCGGNGLAPQELVQLTASNEVHTALKECAALLCKRLETNFFLVLQEDDKGQFTLIFQQQPLNRRPLTTCLPPLEADNRQLLGTSAEVVALEDLDEDLRWVQWHESLNQLGMRSALLVPLGSVSAAGSTGFQTHNESLFIGKTTKPDNSDKLSLLVIGHGTPRTWNHRSRDLASIVAQQINLLLMLGSYADRAQQSFQQYQTFQEGLSTLSQAPLNPISFERTWVEYLARLLECPLTALFSWMPESEWATVAATIVTDPRFALSPDLTIHIASDPLIQEALTTRSCLYRSVSDLPEPTRKWLSSPGICRLLVLPLYTEGMPIAGFVLLADREERQWPHHLLMPLETLTQQFAWFRQYRYRLSRHAQEREALQRLNWYKHRCLETLHESVTQNISVLLDFQTLTPPLLDGSGFNRPHSKDLAQINTQAASSSGQSLRQMRRKQLLQSLEQTLAMLTPVLKEEEWQLKINLRSIALASLLKRSLHRVESLANQRHLRLQVYNSGDKNVYGDLLKLECILFELLATFCVRAQPGSRINLWCCPVSPELSATLNPNSSLPVMDLLIAESAFLDECLQVLDSSSPKPLDSTNMILCQQILHSWGGDLQFFLLEADSGAPSQEPRDLLRLLLPLEK